MRVGRDLGLPNLVVLVVVFVVFPAIGFIIRRKWRHAAARREEIKRLLIFASEEAARAEIEATEGYLHTSDVSSSFPSSDSTWIPASKSAWIPIPSTASVSVAPSSKPPYKCAVCFAPTSTRCAKCKAARYCSGKCQIIHWRQGHKDECRPYVAVKPVKNVSGTFSKQEDGKDLNATSAESGSTFESSSEEYSTFSTPSRSSTETASSSSSDGTSENFMTADSSNNIKPRFSTSFSRVDDGPNGLFFSEPLDFKKSIINGFNKNTNSDSNGSTSSSQVDDGPNGLSFSEPLNFKKSTIKGSNKNTTSASNGSTSSSRVDDGPNGLSFSEPLDFKKSTVKGSIKNTTSASNGSTSSSQVDDGPNGLSFYEPPDFKKFTIDGSKNTTSAPNGSTSSYWVGDDPNRLSFSTPPDFKKSTIDGSNKKISSALNGSTSSYWVDDDANGLSSSEPLDFKKSTIDFSNKNTTSAPNGSTSSSSIKVPYFSKPSTTSSRLYDELDGSNKNTTILDNSAPNGSRSKKSNDEKRCDFPQSMFKETKISSSPTRESISAIPEKSTHAVNTKNVALKSTSRLASQFSKPVTVHEEKNKVSVCSSKQVEHSGGEKNETKKSMQKVVDQPKIPRQCSQHKSTCKGLFSYEMFVKLYNWKQFELKPFGLVNCGNSCYANAVLQCLTHTPPLNAYFLQGLHSKACDKRDWCFTCEFEGIVLKAKNGNTSLSPIRILSHIENIGSSLNHGREEDAHEFLRYAIDTLQSVCLKEAITKATNSLEEETTLIGLTFGGYLKSKIKCMKCGGKSERHERMMDLTVEIEGNIQTLEEALDKFTCTEILDGENKYKCSRCKSYEKAKKKLTLLEAPNVLTIALKRFQSGKFGKLNKSIRFPEVLDMAPYVSGTSDKSPVYRLYGVVVHVDIMNAAFSGHYVCYVKNVENRWFKIDDNRVKEVDVASVLTKGAYMLLYARCWPRAPRILRNLLSRNTQDPKKHKLSSPSFALRSQPWVDHLAIRHRSLEEESSSSSDGSGILSESCSCSTESSNKDSSSVEWDWDHDHEHNSISSSPLWRNLHSNSSDSDTSSSSSSLSSSFPLPLYSSHSTLYHNNDEGRTVICSNSYREVNVDRLGGRPLETSKPALRRSTTRVRSE